MRYAIIDAGVVSNVVLADAPMGGNWVETEEAGPGWSYDGSAFIAPPSPPPPEPQPAPIPNLSFAQLMIGLVSEGWITTAEGEAWLTGTLPAPVLTLIGTLPAGQQFAAKARALRPTIVERTDPLVSALGAAQGKSPEQLDDFFRTYAAI
jgi:hypothetical protein